MDLLYFENAVIGEYVPALQHYSIHNLKVSRYKFEQNKPDFLYLENAIVGENASGMPLVSVFPGENNIGNMPPFHGYLKLH